MNTYPNYPYRLQTFRKLTGQYGTVDVIARSPQQVEFTLTQEFVHFSRADVQELIRVLTAWLAAPPLDAQVVRTHGAGSAVIIEDDGPGSPSVVVVDGDRQARDAHYDR